MLEIHLSKELVQSNADWHYSIWYEYPSFKCLLTRNVETYTDKKQAETMQLMTA